MLYIKAQALRDLAQDEDILVLPADKGKATVVMDRADHGAKVGQMLNDENTYQLDDTFTALTKTLITPFLDHLNGIEPFIKFTVVEKTDRQLAFLDVLLRREDDSTISILVHHKATLTNQYLSFRSHHPTVHKIAVIRTLMTRAENLPSSGVERTEEEKCVTDALRGNAYPSGFIQKHTITSRRRKER